MSERVTLETLPLFAPAAPAAPVQVAHEAAELVHRRYLTKLRAELRREAERTGVPMCADDAHRLMRTTPGLSMPPDMNPSALGTLFRGDRDVNGHARWKMEGYTKSTRAGANDNAIHLWRLIF